MCSALVQYSYSILYSVEGLFCQSADGGSNRRLEDSISRALSLHCPVKTKKARGELGKRWAANGEARCGAPSQPEPGCPMRGR